MSEPTEKHGPDWSDVWDQWTEEPNLDPLPILDGVDRGEETPPQKALREMAQEGQRDGLHDLTYRDMPPREETPI